MILTDTGPLVALINRNDPNDVACVQASKGLPAGPLLTTWPCFTEAMHLLSRGSGIQAQAALLNLHKAGRLMLHDLSGLDLDRMAALMEKYRDQPMDLGDASMVVLAERLHMRRVFSLDQHFRTYRMSDGSAFDIVP